MFNIKILVKRKIDKEKQKEDNSKSGSCYIDIYDRYIDKLYVQFAVCIQCSML